MSEEHQEALSESNRCGYHLCKKKARLKKCGFCGNYYCKEHIDPKPPSMPNFKAVSREERLLMAKWREPGGHPCPPFYGFWEEKYKEERRKYHDWLNDFLSPKPSPSVTPLWEPPPAPEPTPKKRGSIKTVLLGISILLILGYFLQGTFFISPKNCEDGTLNDECSINKPAYCANGYLVPKASLCGCFEGYEARGDDCIEILRCGDGTIYGECSIGKPLFCDNGNLTPNASLCGCAEGYIIFGDLCKKNLTCIDGTFYGECSENKPYFCSNGILVNASGICGCLNGYRASGEICEKIWYCSDATPFDECSINKPLFCLNGSLVNSASVCGCPLDEIALGSECVSKYITEPKANWFDYTLRGSNEKIDFTVYAGLKRYLASIPREYYCTPTCPSDTALEMRFIEEEEQKEAVFRLSEHIKSLTSSKDDQARIAISLVQHIPYDAYGSANIKDHTERYPYEVLYDKRGLCGEKSRLLVLLLGNLGYGTILLDYEKEEHLAVGIKCPEKYSQFRFEGDYYCFIETTQPSIATNDKEGYVGTGFLASTPKMLFVSSGEEFISISEEYEDAKTWTEIYNGTVSYYKTKDNRIMTVRTTPYLSQEEYLEWERIVKKYDIQTEG